MQNNTVIQVLCSSAASSCLTATLLQPLDRLKTVKQQLNNRDKNSWQLARLLAKQEGVVSLWNGLTPTLLRVVPGASLYLCIVNVLRSSLKIDDKNSTGLFVTGLGSRCAVATLMQPTTVVKTRLESSAVFKERSTLTAIQETIRQAGVRGLWRGLFPTLLRDSPFSGLYLVFYRRQVQFFESRYETITPLLRFVSGLVAGVIACLLTQPFDIVKTVVLLYPQKFQSSFEALGDLYKNGGGFRVLFTGFILRATKRTLTAAFSWTLFEELLNAHGTDQHRRRN